MDNLSVMPEDFSTPSEEFFLFVSTKRKKGAPFRQAKSAFQKRIFSPSTAPAALFFYIISLLKEKVKCFLKIFTKKIG